jgi:flagellar motor switch protein FliN/FliY
LKVEVAPGRSGLCPPDQEAACFRLSLEGPLQGQAFLLLKKEDITALEIRKVADGEKAEESQASALFGVLEALLPRLGELISDRYGVGTLTMERADQASLPDDSTMELWAQAQDGSTRASLYMCLDPTLLNSLQGATATLLPDAVWAEQAEAANLDLVMGVELNATLRFGQRQLSLREVLDLTSGSVVELDRQVDDPVELILDGLVVARGEAVIIDGNYGIRITEVLQPLDGLIQSR